MNPTIGTRLALLRRWLSLSIDETVRILDVDRPTIYDWQRGQTPDEADLRRLQELFDIGRGWRDRSSSPVGPRGRLVLDGETASLETLLRASLIDRAAVEALLDRLSIMPVRERAAELAHRHGFPSLSPEEAEANIERETSSIGAARN